MIFMFHGERSTQMHDAYSMKKRPSQLVYVNYHRLSLLYTAILK